MTNAEQQHPDETIVCYQYDIDVKEKEKRQATEAAAQLALSATPEWKSAGRIIGHLWGIFVLLPIILGILGAILINAAK